METDPKGIPLKGPYPASPPVVVLYTVMTSVFVAICSSIAYYTIVKGNTAADDKLSMLAQYDLGYIYLTAIILKLGQFAMGINAGNARKYAKVHPPDQHIYQVKGAEGSKLGYALMDYDGANGKFNRAQRAVQNYNETFPQTVLYILLSGFVYPKQVMTLASVYSAARLLSAVGYTNSTEGRLGGFIFSNLTVCVIECLTGIIAYKVLNM